MSVDASVIVCTHDPRPDYLSQVLAALKSQTLALNRWELLVVDNASTESLAKLCDLSWHPRARHTREGILGLTRARLHGISRATADLLVFVDDDNVLAPNYLETTLGIAAQSPHIGAWGGRVTPSFDSIPPDWTKPYWGWLGIRDFEQDKWSNLYDWNAVPCGAGICVRREVAETYSRAVAIEPLRGELDRKGKRLTGSGDIDLAFTACDLGYGMGQFTNLSLTHLIPVSRLEIDYLTRLARGNGYSGVMLSAMRAEKVSFSYLGTLRRIAQTIMLARKQRRLELARLQGEWLAYRALRNSQLAT